MDSVAGGARWARIFLVMSASSLLLAGCGMVGGGEDRRPASVSRPAPASAQHAPVQGTATLWNVRAGLNVAALSCRKTKGIERDYRKVLERHRSVLASSYAAAQRKAGHGFDREQTRLYNRFAQRFTNPGSCQEAASIARETLAMDSSRLVAQAPTLLGRLNRKLR